MIDRFGREVTKTTEGNEDIYTVEGGLILKFPSGWAESRAMSTINAMAPEGYVAPVYDEELNN